MTPEAKQLLKDKPELCKEIAYDYIPFYELKQNGDKAHWGSSVWEMYIKDRTAKDWEILSFRDLDGSLWNIKGNGLYSLRQIGSCSAESLLEGGYASIHSVRRSDGEVFEVGDEINRGGKIKSFRINNDKMIVNADKSWHLNDVTKIKPLFKTEDGVDVYAGDRTWAVRTGDMFMDYNSHEYTGQGQHYLKYFSTREAAEAWVEDHKPRYSIADLKAMGLHI